MAVETLANTCLSPLNTYILCSKTLHWNFATNHGREWPGTLRKVIRKHPDFNL